MPVTRYVALLRGINVGRAKRIAMADLRQLMGALGHGEVRTLLNSGNVVFSAGPLKPADAAAEIEEALVLKLGVAARVTVLTQAELETVMAENSLLPMATDQSRLMAFVLSNPQDRAGLELLAGRKWVPEALALGQRAAYAWCPEGVLESRLVVALGKQLGDATTARNWNTMCKLATLCAA
ncbi:MAG: DUF1697 domain-containing protein [Pseudomonadota bacterium]